LLHAGYMPAQEDQLRSDAETVTRITHGSPVAIEATIAVAYGLTLAAGTDLPPAEWPARAAAFLGGAGSIGQALAEAHRRLDRGVAPEQVIADLGTDISAHAVVAGAFAAASRSERIEEVVAAAVNGGGASDARGAIAGALFGARAGASGIPQALIDDLEGRIYISLAAPWFHRTALMRSESVVRLEPRD
jgi:ADP-ribosylglycohydrolase